MALLILLALDISLKSLVKAMLNVETKLKEQGVAMRELADA